MIFYYTFLRLVIPTRPNKPEVNSNNDEGRGTTVTSAIVNVAKPEKLVPAFRLLPATVPEKVPGATKYWFTGGCGSNKNAPIPPARRKSTK